MRTPIATALALAVAVACGRSDGPGARGGADAPSAPQLRIPDALVLRLPRAGGLARVVAYPKLDSVVWTSGDPAPALERILAFDEDAGVVAAVDTRGRPVRIDLRGGAVSRLANVSLSSPASADADAVYGVDAKGQVVRHTPAGRWAFAERRASAAFPQSDGSLLVLGERREGSVVWRLRPPDTRIVDSVSLPRVARAFSAAGSDRLYFATDAGLAALRTRTMDLRTLSAGDDSLRALAITPSGDRVFLLAGAEGRTISVIDRYQDRVTHEIELPATASALRMDPLGRYLLAAREGVDSTWVIAVGTGKVLGAVRTTWRGDLPLVAADGAVALAQGADVVWVDGETLRPVTTVRGGASDFWFAFRWTGFRPRDPALDQPVSFGSGTQSTTAQAPPADTVPAASDSAAPAPAPAATGWTVSFAALLSEERARDLAGRIQESAGRAPRVVTSQRDGATIYRVVLGPYPTKDDAERAGRESGQSYWVYEGAP